MTFEEYSKNSKESIIRYLKKVFDKKRDEDVIKNFKNQNILTVLEDFMQNGKFVRGTLFLLTCQFLGEEIDEKKIAIASAIELVHSGLLIQDDIIDHDTVRRGGKTVFSQYEEIGGKIGAADPYHYGISIAMIVADVAFFTAYEILSSYNLPQLPDILAFYSKEIYRVSLAEGIDSEFGQIKTEPSEEEINAVYLYKTARYTFSMPFVLAAIVSGTDSEIQDRLEKIGEGLGIIFQIKDDVIGLFGDEKIIGKPVGSDIRENKKTIIRSLLYQNATPYEKSFLDASFGNPNLTQDDVVKIQQILKTYKIEEQLNAKMDSYMSDALSAFASLNIENEYSKALLDLFEFIQKRAY